MITRLIMTTAKLSLFCFFFSRCLSSEGSKLASITGDEKSLHGEIELSEIANQTTYNLKGWACDRYFPVVIDIYLNSPGETQPPLGRKNAVVSDLAVNQKNDRSVFACSENKNSLFSLSVPYKDVQKLAGQSIWVYAKSQGKTLLLGNSGDFKIPHPPTEGVVTRTLNKTFKAIVINGLAGSDVELLRDGGVRTQAVITEALAVRGIQNDAVKVHDVGGTNAAQATLAHIQKSVTEWAAVGADDVFIFIIGHGSRNLEYISIGAGNATHEKLTAVDLDKWLDILEPQIKGSITVILESCYSGSFILETAGAKRIFLTSAPFDDYAIESNKGLLTFSYFVASEIAFGFDLKSAFLAGWSAFDTLSKTGAEGGRRIHYLESDGDGTVNSPRDYAKVTGYCIGVGYGEPCATSSIMNR